MSTILFDKIVFGPIHSRRLGVSLGMNLLPTDGKLCSFNCIYCECGLNENHRTHSKLPTRTEVREALEQKLSSMKAEGIVPDVITFAGNGEPTIHPEFGGIIDDTVAIRDRFFPDAKIAVLSNSTMLQKEEVFQALNKIEDNILKLDSVLDSRIRQIDVPNSPAFNFESLLKQLCRFNGNLIIQTMFLKGEVNGKSVNNMTEEEIAGWISALKQIRPKQVMIYTIDRETPVKALKKATKEELDAIADYIVDMGPKAGRKGGEVTAIGTIDDIKKSDSLTAQYLNGTKKIQIPEKRREGNGKFLTLKGCTGNNLKKVDVSIPLGMLVCVTGVSGSGKSSLINGTLHPILTEKFYRAITSPLPYKAIGGIEHIDKVVVVDQSPLGRTPRSNPATYTGIFTDIRKIFEKLPEAQIRGYGAGRFSFNIPGGRCEECKGAGVKTIEMNFLPDVYVHCEACDGKRYNKETLEVRYRGKSIGDVLNMTINQAVEFFENVSFLQQKLKVLQDVGLGYVKLGQQCTTLSGGESQRIKLAAELAKKDTGKTLYILDEPTTGLHFEDINILLEVIQKLVNKGNSVIVIEHNLDVIKVADYLIDMGPGGGKEGGKIVATGTPEEVAECKKSETGKFLREELKR